MSQQRTTGPRMMPFIKFIHGKPEIVEETIRHLDRAVGRRKVAVISTCGKFRKGKTFLTNVILKHLQDPESLRTPNTVIGGDGGIPFRGGPERHTEGINIWSEVFDVQMDNGEIISCLVIDTQGTFDNNTPICVSTTIFCLSNIMASSQIFNVKDLIDGSDIDALQTFVNVCNSVQKRCGQRLYFVIRDFEPGKDDYDYGLDTEYLRSVFEGAQNATDLNRALEDLRNSYDNIKCYTIPAPSIAVRRASNAIQVGACGDDFISVLSAFIADLVRNLQPRTILGAPVDGDVYFAHIKNIVQKFKEGGVAQIPGAFQATCELLFERARCRGKEVYNDNTTVFPSLELNPVEYRAQMDLAIQLGLEAYEKETCLGRPEEISFKKDEFLMQLQDTSDRFFILHQQRYMSVHLLAKSSKINDYYLGKIQGDVHSHVRGDRNLIARHQALFDDCMRQFEEGSQLILNGANTRAIMAIKEKQRVALERNLRNQFEMLQRGDNVRRMQDMMREAMKKAVDQFRNDINQFWTDMGQTPASTPDRDHHLEAVVRARDRAFHLFQQHYENVLPNSNIDQDQQCQLITHFRDGELTRCLQIQVDDAVKEYRQRASSALSYAAYVRQMEDHIRNSRDTRTCYIL